MNPLRIRARAATPGGPVSRQAPGPHGIALLLLAVILTGCCTRQPRTPPQRMTALTYNIHHGEGVDGRLDLERIADVIRSSGADVVFLQEVDRGTQRAGGVDQVAELSRLTGLHGVFGESMSFQGGGYGNAILSRRPLEDVRTHPLPGSAGREPRSVVVGTVFPWAGGPPVRVAGTHLDHLRDDADRRRQGERLDDLLDTGDGLPTVLAGDFNATPDGAPMPQLLSRWRDAAAEAPEATVPVGDPTRRIDYILLQPASAWRVVRVDVLPEAVASDHRAVVAEIEWTGHRGPAAGTGP